MTEPPDTNPATHPTTQLTELVHQRARLGILTVLSECGRADFGYLKTLLELTDGNLGRHLEILADDGLITISKGYEGKRPRTWAEITRAGEGALAAQMAAMKQLVMQFESRQAAERQLPDRDGPQPIRRSVFRAPPGPRITPNPA
jgi:DNA-binding MarR family transcriptional regulator